MLQVQCSPAKGHNIQQALVLKNGGGGDGLWCSIALSGMEGWVAGHQVTHTCARTRAHTHTHSCNSPAPKRTVYSSQARARLKFCPNELDLICAYMCERLPSGFFLLEILSCELVLRAWLVLVCSLAIDTLHHALVCGLAIDTLHHASQGCLPPKWRMAGHRPPSSC